MDMCSFFFRGDSIDWRGAGWYRSTLVSTSPRTYRWVPISEEAYETLANEGYYVVSIANDSAITTVFRGE